MKPRFVWSLPMAEIRALGPLRRWADVESLEAGPLVWLRASSLAEDEWELVRRLPGADRFTVIDDGRLTRVGCLVPCSRMPSGAWQPLKHWLRVELPASAEPSPDAPAATLRLIRSTEEREAGWLQTTLEAWTTYAVAAPQVRLQRWLFVVDGRGVVVVRGSPLPTLPGLRLVDHGGIAVPAGWIWTPRLPADVVRDAFGLGAGETLLWTADGACRRIAPDDWVQATRSAVRLTAAAVQR